MFFYFQAPLSYHNYLISVCRFLRLARIIFHYRYTVMQEIVQTRYRQQCFRLYDLKTINLAS